MDNKEPETPTVLRDCYNMDCIYLALHQKYLFKEIIIEGDGKCKRFEELKRLLAAKQLDPK